jgi:hypothetical protein
MPRTDRFWRPVHSARAEWVRCPLCRTTCVLTQVLLAHTRSRDDYLRCDGEGMTLQAARALDALRQRAHP